jgi:hypothetical protein
MRLNITVCKNIIDNTKGKPLKMVVVDPKDLTNITQDELIEGLKKLYKED